MSEQLYRVEGDPEDLAKTIIFNRTNGLVPLDIFLAAIKKEFPEAYEDQERIAVASDLETGEIRVWELHPITAAAVRGDMQCVHLLHHLGK